MAPTTFHLLTLKPNATEADIISKLQSLPKEHRPLFIGQCQDWIHLPHLSTDSLVGRGPEVKKWDYLLVQHAEKSDVLALPSSLKSLVIDFWSIVAEVNDEMLSTYSQAQRARLSNPAPSLPDGWSAADHSVLDGAVPPEDLEMSLGVPTYTVGSRPDTPVQLKGFVRNFGKRNGSAVSMFNLLSYLPEQRPRYFEYMAAFAASVGSKYGGEAQFAGLGVVDWSSAKQDNHRWEDCALVWYPSIWHFGKMLDDPGYADADRRFKQGVIKDNPILCCTEIDIGYAN